MQKIGRHWGRGEEDNRQWVAVFCHEQIIIEIIGRNTCMSKSEHTGQQPVLYEEVKVLVLREVKPTSP